MLKANPQMSFWSHSFLPSQKKAAYNLGVRSTSINRLAIICATSNLIAGSSCLPIVGGASQRCRTNQPSCPLLIAKMGSYGLILNYFTMAASQIFAPLSATTALVAGLISAFMLTGCGSAQTATVNAPTDTHAETYQNKSQNEPPQATLPEELEPAAAAPQKIDTPIIADIEPAPAPVKAEPELVKVFEQAPAPTPAPAPVKVEQIQEATTKSSSQKYVEQNYVDLDTMTEEQKTRMYKNMDESISSQKEVEKATGDPNAGAGVTGRG